MKLKIVFARERRSVALSILLPLLFFVPLLQTSLHFVRVNYLLSDNVAYDIFMQPSIMDRASKRRMLQSKLIQSPRDDEKGPAIAILLPNIRNDIEKAKAAVKSMDRHLADNATTPLLLFNEGNVPYDVIEEFMIITDRRVFAPSVNFTDFPKGFNHTSIRHAFEKRSRWGYWMMCRFWIYTLWTHPILDNYSTVMRMDTDSCFLGDTDPSLPNLPDSSKHVYVANKLVRASTTKLLIETTHKFFNTTSNHSNLEPKNPALWNLFPDKTQHKITRTPAYYTNFEVMKISFFRQPSVMAFQNAIANEEPFGVFKNQWGDAPVRALTLAIFASGDQIAEGYNTNYAHSAECKGLWPKGIKNIG